MPTDNRLRNPDWDVDELVLALDVYMSAKPRDLQKNSREVAELSTVLRRRLSALGVRGEPTLRNVAGVYMKLQNLKAHDPSYVSRGRKGLSAGNRLERAVWERYEGRASELHQRAEQLRSFIASDVNILPLEDDAPSDDALLSQEGRVLVRVHKRYERSASNRSRKVAQFRRANGGRVFCECCGFDFERVYGPRGTGFIEVHHAVPVSRLTPDKRLSLEDLRLLCANCHRMVHVCQPWLTVDEVRALMSRRN